MQINVDLQEFYEKWSLAEYTTKKQEIYVYGSLYGIIMYENSEYIVIKILNN